MIKFYENYDRIRLKMESDIVYEEVSSAIYIVAKNRKGVSYSRYVDTDIVIGALNNQDKISVLGKDRIYANFELSEI